MKPETPIRAASLLSYVTGFGTLLSVGPSLAYNLSTGKSPGTLLGLPPSFGDFLGSSPIGSLWGLPGALVVGCAFLAFAALSAMAGYWLWRFLKKGGEVGVVASLGIMVCAIALVLPAWLAVAPITVVLLSLGWRTLR